MIKATQHTGTERGNAGMVLALVHENAGFTGVSRGARGLGGMMVVSLTKNAVRRLEEIDRICPG